MSPIVLLVAARQETGPARHDDDDSYGDVATYYRDFYAVLPCGRETGIVARLAHTRMEKHFGSDVEFARVVEVGAGEVCTSGSCATATTPTR